MPIITRNQKSNVDIFDKKCYKTNPEIELIQMSEYFGLMLPKDFFSHSTGESNPWNSKVMLKSWGAEYLVFVSSRSHKTREKYTNWLDWLCYLAGNF